MLLICQQNSSTLPFKMQQDTVGMWAPLTYVMLCWERIPTRIQLNRHLKSKIKSSICHFAVFPQPKVISNCTLPFIPRTSPIQKDQMAPEICLSEILALAVIINMEIERTGQYASKPSTFFLLFLPVHLQALPLGHFQKLNFLQGELDGKSATIQHSQIPSISFHVVSQERM